MSLAGSLLGLQPVENNAHRAALIWNYHWGGGSRGLTERKDCPTSNVGELLLTCYDPELGQMWL